MLRGFPDLPPVWALGCALVSTGLARAVPLWRLDAGAVGDAVFWAGIVLILWAAIWFWRKRTPIEPNHTPRSLIVEGPYRINRNPIYTGLALVLAGYALGLGAVSALLPVLAFPAIMTARFIRAEEAALRKAFGAQAEVWLARTRRW